MGCDWHLRQFQYLLGMIKLQATIESVQPLTFVDWCCSYPQLLGPRMAPNSRWLTTLECQVSVLVSQQSVFHAHGQESLEPPATWISTRSSSSTMVIGMKSPSLSADFIEQFPNHPVIIRSVWPNPRLCRYFEGSVHWFLVGNQPRNWGVRQSEYHSFHVESLPCEPSELGESSGLVKSLVTQPIQKTAFYSKPNIWTKESWLKKWFMGDHDRK